MIQPAAPTTVAACCSAIYGSPISELLVGDSLHPGGREATRELLNAAQLRPAMHLLDAGCGLGASARLAAEEFGVLVDAVDASGAVLERARRRGEDARIQWREAALAALPYPDGAFDAVLAECVLSTTDRAAALLEIQRVLRPGGRLLLSDIVSSGATLPTTIDPLVGAALCVSGAWREGEMETRLGEAGYRIAACWRRSSAIASLINRVSARARVIGLAAQDLGLDLGSMIASSGLTIDTSPAGQAELAAAADDVIREVTRGRLHYVAMVAVRGDAAA